MNKQTQHQQQTEHTHAKTVKKPKVQGLETAVINPIPALQRAYTDPRTLSPADAQTLQRTIGNLALGQLIIQRKMTIGSVSNKYEQEADAIAKQVIGKLNPSATSTESIGTVQRQQEEGELQMKPLPAISFQQRQTNTLNRSHSTLAAATGQDIFFRQSENISRSPDHRIQRGLLDYLPSWGTTGETTDTTSASLEAIDAGLGTGNLLAEGSNLTAGSAMSGSLGGAMSGTKDIVEAAKEGVGVESGLKAVGGVSGLAGGVVKGADAFGGDQAKALLETVAAGGGETIGGWLDYLSGGTKAISGTYLTGKSQIHYNRVKEIVAASSVPKIQGAAQKLMEIINEKWWLGLWGVGIGALEMAATITNPALATAAKTTGAVTKVVGGDIIWKTISWASSGRIRSNDDIDSVIEAHVGTLTGDAPDLAKKALIANDTDNLKNLYLSAKEFAPEFAEALASAIKNAPVRNQSVNENELRRRKRSLKNIVWE